MAEESVEPDIFSIKQEEFKDLNIDFWIDLAVRQCIAAGLTDSMKYMLAVHNLEGACVTRLDDEYRQNVEKVKNELRKTIPEDEIEIALADTKFKELIALIDRKKAKEEIYEL